ncbi:hypothetical protein AACH28_21490 [Sphingobacterium thalpophilum]|uniref:Uncharacterized protein n=1 Tax=Sphingobacterium thalpophilum TaxID=259 RepID=A0ACD5C066_9SPHI
MVKNKKDRVQEQEKDDTIIEKNERPTVFSFVAKMYLEILALLALLITYIVYTCLIIP